MNSNETLTLADDLTISVVADRLIIEYDNTIREVWADIPTCERLDWTRAVTRRLEADAPTNPAVKSLVERLKTSALKYDSRITDHVNMTECKIASDYFICPTAR